jgi:hypothetical protein
MLVEVPQLARYWTSPAGPILRLLGLSSLLALALPQGVSAQGIGTMQVSARVLPAGPTWTALSEARAAAQAVLADPHTRSSSRSTQLVRAYAELQGVGSRRRLLITLHHPHN